MGVGSKLMAYKVRTRCWRPSVAENRSRSRIWCPSAVKVPVRVNVTPSDTTFAQGPALEHLTRGADSVQVTRPPLAACTVRCSVLVSALR